MKKSHVVKAAALFAAVVLSLSMNTVFAATESTTDAAEQYRSQVILLVNAERAKAGVAEIVPYDVLSPMADVRAAEAAVQFKHTRPNGTRCFTIFADNDMTYSAAGENLAYGFSTPEAVVTAWMNSPSHRQNILDPDFMYIGIGYYFNDTGTLYVSQLFYTPKDAE